MAKSFEFDFSKLLGRMREKAVTQEEVAKAIGISATSLNNKLTGKVDFKNVETFAICELLGIDDPTPYFFTVRL